MVESAFLIALAYSHMSDFGRRRAGRVWRFSRREKDGRRVHQPYPLLYDVALPLPVLGAYRQLVQKVGSNIGCIGCPEVDR